MTTLEPFTALAAAATATERLRVGTFVLPAPFYPPSEIAWRALALDLLSGGRFDLGLGRRTARQPRTRSCTANAASAPRPSG